MGPSRVFQHDSAVDFLAVTYPTLRQHERSANIVLAHALNRAPAEYVLTDCQFLTDGDIQLPNATHPHRASNFWVTVWSYPPQAKPVLDLVLSCLESTLGNYPIFLWTPMPQSALSSEWLGHRMESITEHLHSCIEPERVFSVFGTTTVVNSFARAWATLTHFEIIPQPVYEAFFSFCTPQSLRAAIVDVGIRTRRAAMRDLEVVARLCQEFTNDSYYHLTVARATMEARELIDKGQLWVCETKGEIASICAVTRSSLYVSAITKVYTTPKWRRHGFAERLVREVTQILFKCSKHSVVLYVGCENNAQRIYRRVGFSWEEVWMEVGFAGTDRGHW
ncbi:acyl-CoA N-acyltransferase [Mycena sp. CBHHK59/15]|nr:acyl-CoA N-acyltransferase [Mycena sp. CBHHK59/15]